MVRPACSTTQSTPRLTAARRCCRCGELGDISTRLLLFAFESAVNVGLPRCRRRSPVLTNVLKSQKLCAFFIIIEWHPGGLPERASRTGKS